MIRRLERLAVLVGGFVDAEFDGLPRFEFGNVNNFASFTHTLLRLMIDAR